MDEKTLYPEVQTRNPVLHTPFGEIEYTEADVFHFSEGLYGFEDSRRFLLHTDPDYHPFVWLLSVDEPGLRFPVIDPRLVMPDYNPNLRQESRPDAILAIVTIGHESGDVSANLRAPLLLSRKRRSGKQVILTDATYPLRHRIACGKN